MGHVGHWLATRPPRLGHRGRHPGEYLRALVGQQFQENDRVENQVGEAEGGQSDTPSVDD